MASRCDAGTHAIIAEFLCASVKDWAVSTTRGVSNQMHLRPMLCFQLEEIHFKLNLTFIALLGPMWGGALPGWVLTTDSRRPCHRWEDSETHLPCAPYWPALATSRWAAHVWTRTPPSERKGGKGGTGVMDGTKMKRGKTTQIKNWWEVCPRWQLMNS